MLKNTLLKNPAEMPENTLSFRQLQLKKLPTLQQTKF